MTAHSINETSRHHGRQTRKNDFIHPAKHVPVGTEKSYFLADGLPFHASGMFFLLVDSFFTDFLLKFF